jgi:glycosyltransferase involved in cell wall biosynthesis
MSTHFEVLAVSSPGKVLDDVSVHEGVRTAPVQMTRAVTPVKDLKALWSLYRLFKKERPAIVHTHTPKAGLLGMMASRMAGVPIRLHTVAGLPLMENKGFKKRVLEFTEKLTYRYATKVYPNSSVLARYILDNKYCKKDKLKVLGNGSSNGIDMDFFQSNSELVNTAAKLRESLGIQENDFVFVFIGRLVKDKGIEELTAAFSRLKQKHTNVKLLLVGPYEPELDPLSDEANNTIKTDKDIIQVDFQQDIRPYLLLSQVLAFPTYREGFPNVPMQAGCLHLPSIVTDINGCNEIVDHRKNGLIIPVKNVEALLEAMDLLLTDQALYLTLKSNARRLIAERYEQKYFWGLLLNEYSEHLKVYEIVS